MEKRIYKWQQKGDQTLDDPVKKFDHLMDAERYGIFTHCQMNSGELATATSGQEVESGILAGFEALENSSVW